MCITRTPCCWSFLRSRPFVSTRRRFAAVLPHARLLCNFLQNTFYLPPLLCSACSLRLSLVTSSTAVRLPPATSRSKTGHGVPPIFLPCCFLPSTACFPGLRCFCSPRWD